MTTLAVICEHCKTVLPVGTRAHFCSATGGLIGNDNFKLPLELEEEIRRIVREQWELMMMSSHNR